MPIIKIKLGSRDFELACPEENQDHIFDLAKKLDIQIKRFQEANPSSSFELAMTVTALNLIEAKDSALDQQVKNDIEDAVKIASEKAAGKAWEEAAQEIEKLKAELNAAKSELEGVKIDLSKYKESASAAYSEDEIKAIDHHLQNLLIKLG